MKLPGRYPGSFFYCSLLFLQLLNACEWGDACEGDGGTALGQEAGVGGANPPSPHTPYTGVYKLLSAVINTEKPEYFPCSGEAVNYQVGSR